MAACLGPNRADVFMTKMLHIACFMHVASALLQRQQTLVAFITKRAARNERGSPVVTKSYSFGTKGAHMLVQDRHRQNAMSFCLTHGGGGGRLVEVKQSSPY